MYKAILLISVILSINLFPQTMNVYTSNGSVNQYNIAEIDSITFSATSNTVYIVNEDFESYEVGTFPYSGGWNLVYNGYGNEYQYVSDSTSISGTKSLQLEGQTNWMANAQKEFSETPEIIFYEVYVKTKKLAGSVMNYAEAAVALYNPNIGTWGTAYAEVTFRYDEKIWFGYNNVELQNWLPDTWYKVKVKYDQVNKTGDVWINDELKASNVDFSNLTGTYDSIELVSGNDTHTRSWFDDVKVWYEQ